MGHSGRLRWRPAKIDPGCAGVREESGARGPNFLWSFGNRGAEILGGHSGNALIAPSPARIRSRGDHPVPLTVAKKLSANWRCPHGGPPPPLFFKSAHLEKAAQPVLDVPGLDDLAVLELMNVDGHDLERPAFRREASEVAGLGSLDR